MKPVSPYVIGLREIPAEGLRKSYDLSGEFARAALAETEVEVDDSSIQAKLDLSRSGEEVLVRGNIAGGLTMVCSRCAGAAPVTVDVPVAALFLPRDADAPQPDVEDVEAPDVIAYDDDQIDIHDLLREELLLALPYAPLCKEDCKGLCSNCGKDLNDGPCGCVEASADDRLTALRNLKV